MGARATASDHIGVTFPKQHPAPEQLMTHLVVRIPKSLHKRLRLHCADHGTLIRTLIAAAVQEALTKAMPKRKKAAQ